jgi:hypothetical protein
MKGEFDPSMLVDALKWISVAAKKMGQGRHESAETSVSVGRSDTEMAAIIAWSGLKGLDHDPFRSFIGSDEIRMSLAARIVEAHGGSAEHQDSRLVVKLPLSE